MNHSRTTLTAGVGHEARFSLRMLLAGVAALFVVAADAATDNNWRKVDGDANGSMNDTDPQLSPPPCPSLPFHFQLCLSPLPCCSHSWFHLTEKQKYPQLP